MSGVYIQNDGARLKQNRQNEMGLMHPVNPVGPAKLKFYICATSLGK